MSHKNLIVELDPGVYLASGAGDPSRTLLKDNAKRFCSYAKATSGLLKARRYRDFISARIIECDCTSNATTGKVTRYTRPECWDTAAEIYSIVDDIRDVKNEIEWEISSNSAMQLIEHYASRRVQEAVTDERHRCMIRAATYAEDHGQEIMEDGWTGLADAVMNGLMPTKPSDE